MTLLKIIKKLRVKKTKPKIIILSMCKSLIILSLGLLMTINLTGCEDNSSDGEPPRRKIQALTYCQILVKQSLRSPSTADFPFNPNITISEDRKVYTIRSYVDAQNAFGATVRQKYHCKMHYTGNGPIDGLELLDFILIE